MCRLAAGWPLSPLLLVPRVPQPPRTCWPPRHRRTRRRTFPHFRDAHHGWLDTNGWPQIDGRNLPAYDPNAPGEGPSDVRTLADRVRVSPQQSESDLAASELSQLRLR